MKEGIIQKFEIAADAWCDQNLPANWTDDVDKYLPIWNAKFAELIVRECETVLVEKMKEYDSMADRQLSAQAMELARTLILNRFGMV